MPGDRERLAELKQNIAALEIENAQLRELVSKLEQLVVKLEARVVELEAELSRHSGNSSKPPSSDTLAQRAAQKAKRAAWTKKKRRKPGKQRGAPGKHLMQKAQPDEVVRHVPQVCGACGKSLARAPIEHEERRQVFEIPEPKLCVTEHVCERRRCRRGELTRAPFPSEASAPAVWGTRTRALATYLMFRQHLPVARTAEMLEDVFDAPVSTGWLSSLSFEAERGLEGFIDQSRKILASSQVIGVDETGARISGEKCWFHTTGTELVTLIDCHKKRGKDATDDIGVLPVFEGVAVHDRWKTYFKYGCTHAVCGAHLLRLGRGERSQRPERVDREDGSPTARCQEEGRARP